MLKIHFGDMQDVIENTSVYFDNTYEDEWITSDIAKEIIKDIDKSEVLDKHCIMSPVLGQIPPTELSCGTKTLLLMLFDNDNVFNASNCGDNCAKWILKIAEEKDLLINLYHTMDFSRAADTFNIEIVNDGGIVHTIKEYLNSAFKYLD
ncbi:MAG: DUF4869 domain-containing protein [Lachnospiraceae bacterium]|nr:DUF4869 domain-containing protein [Lachnospiraceae bacterium]